MIIVINTLLAAIKTLKGLLDAQKKKTKEVLHQVNVVKTDFKGLYLVI